MIVTAFNDPPVVPNFLGFFVFYSLLHGYNSKCITFPYRNIPRFPNTIYFYVFMLFRHGSPKADCYHQLPDDNSWMTRKEQNGPYDIAQVKAWLICLFHCLTFDVMFNNICRSKEDQDLIMTLQVAI